MNKLGIWILDTKIIDTKEKMPILFSDGWTWIDPILFLSKIYLYDTWYLISNYLFEGRKKREGEIWESTYRFYTHAQRQHHTITSRKIPNLLPSRFHCESNRSTSATPLKNHLMILSYGHQPRFHQLNFTL